MRSAFLTSHDPQGHRGCDRDPHCWRGFLEETPFLIGVFLIGYFCVLLGCFCGFLLSKNTSPFFYSQFLKLLLQYLHTVKIKNPLDFPYKICYHICRYKISSKMLFSKHQLNYPTPVNVTLSDFFSKQRTGKNVHKPLQSQGLSR